MPANNRLKYKLYQIKRVFDVDSLLTLQPDLKYIQKYYKASEVGYSLYYRSSDRMYMGISRDGVYKDEDLLEAARIVEKYIKKLRARNVLELATGRGATSAYLAKKYPELRFDGIELSPAQFKLAKKKAKKIPNYAPIAGDYHSLDHYADNSMDIVFVIEALCYSTDKSTVLAEVKRVLKKGGIFIILDGYTLKDRSKMTRDELLACQLAEKALALSVFEDHKTVMRKVERLGFSIISSENVSKFILPTLRRFERLAQRYFRRPRTARVIKSILPRELTYNAIAGLLMPDVIGNGLLGYYITVLENKK